MHDTGRIGEQMNTFLWGVVPYLIIATFFVGHFFRYKYDQFGVTAKSSQFLDSKSLKWGILLFHVGLLAVFGGHVVGLLVPKEWTEAVGITEHMYHTVAVSMGSVAGIVTLIGMILLTNRRVSKDYVRATSSVGDIFVNILLLLTLIFGLLATLVSSSINHDFDYRETIAPWIRNIFIFHPQPELMKDVPLFFKIHVMSALLIFAVFPFTRLIHAWSVPISYFHRRYTLYRRNPKQF